MYYDALYWYYSFCMQLKLFSCEQVTDFEGICQLKQQELIELGDAKCMCNYSVNKDLNN